MVSVKFLARSTGNPTVIRNPTIAEKRWSGVPTEFMMLARARNLDPSERLLGYVWSGLDKLTSEVLNGIDVTSNEEELERNITQLLEIRIRDVMPASSPFYIQHAVRENETRLPPPAQAPEYDLAFCLHGNPRVMWPIEAKVLDTAGQVSEYIKAIHGNFLTCRYAPFSSEAAMLAYLVSGDINQLFVNLEAKIPCTLNPYAGFSNRPHKVSSHTRHVPNGKPYPAQISLHHLVLRLNEARAVTRQTRV
jgi:hypothetical protein